MSLSVKSLILLSFLAFSFSASHASETVKGAKKDIESFKKEMAAKLEESEKRLKELRSKAAKKGDQVQDQTVQELEATQSRLKGELDTAKVEAKSNWAKFKSTMASSIEDLNAKIQKKLKD